MRNADAIAASIGESPRPTSDSATANAARTDSVARPGSNVEDDGWVVAFVHDGNDDSAEFVVLDAQNFDRGYVARMRLPQRVPFGFHGNWCPDRG